VGQVSKVVAGDDGFYIFRVIEKLPQQARSPEGAREEVETLLRREKERATQEAKTEELRKAAVIHIQEEQLARIH
jgi:parvulin-like peptidyl-prolyl isomerase